MSNSGLLTASHNAAKISRGYDWGQNLQEIQWIFQWQGLATVASWCLWSHFLINCLTDSSESSFIHGFRAAFVWMPRMLLQRFEPISKDSDLWMFFPQIWSHWLTVIVGWFSDEELKKKDDAYWIFVKNVLIGVPDARKTDKSELRNTLEGTEYKKRGGKCGMGWGSEEMWNV